MVLITKKDGNLCICVDYHKLNSYTWADAYPMPRINDLIGQLSQEKNISTLDLLRDYWKVPVIEVDKHKTAFMTQYGLYEF